MEGRDIQNLAEAYQSIYINEMPTIASQSTTNKQNQQKTQSPTTAPTTTATTTPPANTGTATAPPTSTAPKPVPPNLNDLRAASARATMAGPSREAQALMSDRTKALLGPQRLQAGAQAQDRVAQMRASIPSPTSTPRAAINPEWAKANPKLAAAEMERRRISGTAQSDNPLITPDMRARMPLNSPSVQSPDVAKLGSGYSRLVNNPNAMKASAPAARDPFKDGGGEAKMKATGMTRDQVIELGKQNAARLPQSTPTAPTTQQTQQTQSTQQKPASTLTPQQLSLYQQAYQNRNNPLAKSKIQQGISQMSPSDREALKAYIKAQGQDKDWSGYKFESYVINHLMIEGYADTQQAAQVIMANMSEEWIQDIMEREDSPYEKASDAALDARYGYGRATGDKRSFGRAANRASAAAMLRRLRRDRDEGRETSREAGADAVHQGWAYTARTSKDQTSEKKQKRKQLADTKYSDLPNDEQEKDRVSADAVRAVYNRNKNKS